MATDAAKAAAVRPTARQRRVRTSPSTRSGSPVFWATQIVARPRATYEPMMTSPYAGL